MATSVQLVFALLCVLVSVSCKPQQSSQTQPQPQQLQMKVQQKSDPSIEPVSGISVGNTKGFEIKQGYSFNLANSPDGTPYSSGWAYLGGRAGPGPVYYTEDSSRSFLPAQLWNREMVDYTTAASYVAAATIACASLWYTFSPIVTNYYNQRSGNGSTPSKKVTPAKKEEAKEGTGTPSSEETKAEEPKKESRKSRRRRDIQKVTVPQTDADLTRLASIVLNAIQSGECLQKTICQLGTQIGASPKGRLAFTLIDTLLPPRVHENSYFITMKKALKGDGDKTCEKFQCHYQTYQ